MNAKTYLMQYQRQQIILKNKLIERKRWNEIATGITPQTNGERVQSSGSKSKLEDAVCQIADIDAEIRAVMCEAMEIQQGIVKRIETLRTDEYDVLHKVYVQGIPLGDLPRICNRSKRTIACIHGRALQSLQRILDGEEKCS